MQLGGLPASLAVPWSAHILLGEEGWIDFRDPGRERAPGPCAPLRRGGEVRGRSLLRPARASVLAQAGILVGERAGPGLVRVEEAPREQFFLGLPGWKDR